MNNDIYNHNFNMISTIEDDLEVLSGCVMDHKHILTGHFRYKLNILEWQGREYKKLKHYRLNESALAQSN